MGQVSTHARGVDNVIQAELIDQGVEFEEEGEGLANPARSTKDGDLHLWREDSCQKASLGHNVDVSEDWWRKLSDIVWSTMICAGSSRQQAAKTGHGAAETDTP